MLLFYSPIAKPQNATARRVRFNYWVTCPLDAHNANSVSRIVRALRRYRRPQKLKQVPVTHLRPSIECHAGLDQKKV